MAWSPHSRFRSATLQCVADLRAIVIAAGPASLDRIASRIPGLPDSSALVRAAQRGARLDEETLAFHPALALAATLPSEGAGDFAVATAFLLADRLQGGAGRDDLYWHYDAHRDAYGALPPDLRAPILKGYRLLHCAGRVTLECPPDPLACASRPYKTVQQALAVDPSAEAQPFLEALRSPTARGAAEVLWLRVARRSDLPHAIVAAARHLYETDDGWDPYRGLSEDRLWEEWRPLPYPCPLPLPDGET